MTELAFLNNDFNATERIEIQNLDLIQNYSLLINKLEQLALNATFDKLPVGHNTINLGNGDSIANSRGSPPHNTLAHGFDGVEYSRVVSDIWVGVILTLLIVSVIFFICACFLYHKFQQWKNSYRTNNNENIDVCRNCPPNYEAESLPSYTIVSGLPSYDDAIEQFRKAQSLLTPPIPIIKLFEANEKNRDHIYSIGGGISDVDNVSVASLNSCSYCSSLNTSENNAAPQIPTMNNTQLIELSPEQLASLSEKRLSLQIVFPPHTVRNSRPRVDLRNNLLRSRILVNAAGYEGNFPQIHRSNSLRSLSYERDNTHMMQLNFQHRGSLH